jgi:ribosomal-protein-alanine N-acetyltransferase
MIETSRLLLLPATPDFLRADLEGPAELAARLGFRVPPGWPPELYDAPAIEYTLAHLEAHPGTPQWGFYYFVRKPEGPAGSEEAFVLGAGGYKGAPAEGTVEVGYSILADHQRRGYATEAVRGFLAHAFSHGEVERVIAQTLPELAPSIGVLEKCGFHLLGAGSEEGAICYEITRDEWKGGES